MRNPLRPEWELRLRRYAIPNLMRIIVIGQAVAYALMLHWPVRFGGGLYSLLALSRAGLVRGQLWRLITFIFLPPSSSPIFILFALYFYYLIGTRLEAHWGSVRFDLFYLVGMLGAILSALLTGWADNTYLNLSLFLAYASVWPDEEVLLMMILPIRMKHLALLDVLLYAAQFIRGGASTRVTIIFSLLNVLLFVGGDLLHTIRRDSKYWKTRRNFRNTMWR